MKILRIDSSIKPEGAISVELTDKIIAKLGAETITTRRAADVAPIDANWLGAVFTPAEGRNEAQAEIAAASDNLIDEVKAADIIVIGVPVYNFNIPAGLKNWIDQITRAGVTFQYGEAGPEGLITGKRAILAFSSDGTAAGSDYDFAQRYMKHILGFIGITDVATITAQEMAFNKEAAIATADTQIAELA